MSDCVEKIIEIMRNFPGFKFSARELHKPSTECVVSIYLELLKNMGIDAQNFRNKLSTEAHYHGNHYDPDLTFYIKLYSVIQKILSEASYNHFDLMDILEPRVESVAHIVDILSNIYLFMKTNKDTVDEIVEEASEQHTKYKEMLVLKEKLKGDINCQSKNKVEFSMMREQLKKQISQIEQRLFERLEEKDSITESLTKAKVVLAEYDHKISKLETVGQKLDQTIYELKQQIVTSPEQLVQNLEHLKITEQKFKEEEIVISEALQNKKLRLEELKNCAHTAQAVREEMEIINVLINELSNLEIAFEQSEKEKLKLEQELLIKKEEVEWMKREETELQQKVDSLKEQLFKTKEKAQKRLAEIQETETDIRKALKETAYTKKELQQQLDLLISKFKTEEFQISDEILAKKKLYEDKIKKFKELNHMLSHLCEDIAELRRHENI